MLSVEIQSQKNLLAFSAGIDSTALFFILQKQNIPFDIAIVDYNLRDQSKDEVSYAKELALKYKKKIFIKEFPKNQKFSEKYARDFRYDFFDELMLENSYESLLTAHQLNDKLEWFMMQLSKGAGLSELLGLNAMSTRKKYKLLRPLLKYSKEQLKEFLEKNNIKYFVDESNIDHKYKRNYIREKFTNEFISNYQNGVVNSIDYLEDDLSLLEPIIQREDYESLVVFTFHRIEEIQAIRIIDKELKKRGILITKATRDEILFRKELVVSHKIAVSITAQKIYIAPYITDISMKKEFRESCRINKIPNNIRAYLSTLDQFSFEA